MKLRLLHESLNDIEPEDEAALMGGNLGKALKSETAKLNQKMWDAGYARKRDTKARKAKEAILADLHAAGHLDLRDFIQGTKVALPLKQYNALDDERFEKLAAAGWSGPREMPGLFPFSNGAQVILIGAKIEDEQGNVLSNRVVVPSDCADYYFTDLDELAAALAAGGGRACDGKWLRARGHNELATIFDPYNSGRFIK